jgi:hypothetical protein
MEMPVSGCLCSGTMPVTESVNGIETGRCISTFDHQEQSDFGGVVIVKSMGHHQNLVTVWRVCKQVPSATFPLVRGFRNHHQGAVVKLELL